MSTTKFHTHTKQQANDNLYKNTFIFFILGIFVLNFETFELRLLWTIAQ